MYVNIPAILVFVLVWSILFGLFIRMWRQAEAMQERMIRTYSNNRVVWKLYGNFIESENYPKVIRFLFGAGFAVVTLFGLSEIVRFIIGLF